MDKKQQSACYTQNKKRRNEFGNRLGDLGIDSNDIQYNPHGLNRYIGETCFVALFTYNPQPYDIWLLNSLEAEIGLKKGHLVGAYKRSYYHEAIFQFSTRGNIRDFKSNEQVHIVVPDMSASDYMSKGWLTGCKVDTSYAIKIKDSNKGGRPAGFQKVYNLQKHEKSAFSKRFRPQFVKDHGRIPNINNTGDKAEFEIWLKELRSPPTAALAG
jgi:hypothetical protein